MNYTEETATAKAKAVAKQLGKGWKIHILNTGYWHWYVAKGPISVFAVGNDNELYRAQISDDPEEKGYGYNPAWTCNGIPGSRTPEMAILRAVEPMVTTLERLVKVGIVCAGIMKDIRLIQQHGIDDKAFSTTMRKMMDRKSK